MQQMLKDSVLFAKDDINLRQFRELQVEARRTLEAIDSALAKDKTMLKAEMLADITRARAELAAVVKANDSVIIQAKIDNLEHCAEKFVELRMNNAVSIAMHGRSIDEF
jgi:molecular chaperone HscA